MSTDGQRTTFENQRLIFESGLPPRRKFLAVALALSGDETGEGIRIGVRTLAAWLGCGRRAVQYGLRDLERDGVICPRFKGGYASGRNAFGTYTSVYALNVDRLPLAEGRKHLRPLVERVQPVAPLESTKGATQSPKGRNPKRAKGAARGARSTLEELRRTPKDARARRRSGRMASPPGKYDKVIGRHR